MIDDNIQVKIDALIDTIKESQEYKRYIEIDKVLNKNKEINNLVNDVKKMQQRAVMLEYHKDHRYKKLDDKVKKLIDELNSIPLYQEYTRRLNDLNDMISYVTYNIEEYINTLFIIFHHQSYTY